MTANQWYASVPVIGYLALYTISIGQAASKASKQEDFDPTENSKRASAIINGDPDVRLYHLLAMLVNSLICIVAGCWRGASLGYGIGRIQ